MPCNAGIGAGRSPCPPAVPGRFRRREGSPGRRSRGAWRNSISVQDKAVLSPPFTPARSADRECGRRGISAVLHHLLPNICCHHFLSDVIKSAMNPAKTTVIAAVLRHEKCHQAPLQAIFGGYYDTCMVICRIFTHYSTVLRRCRGHFPCGVCMWRVPRFQ